MPTKKIRDILPPRRVARELPAEKEKKSESSKKRSTAPRFRGVFWIASVVIILAGVAGALSLHFIFATAKVSIWPNTREVTLAESIMALPGEKALDPTTLMIPASTITEEKEVTRLFAATGKAQEAQKAQGTIRVFNGFSTFPQKLVANTRFLSQEGKLFRSTKAVVVPAGRMDEGKLVAGFLDIEVVAAEAGEEYNIGPSNFSLPGLFGNPAYTSIYGKSEESMTGGLQKEVTIVAESDLTQARDTLVKELQQNVKALLEAKVGENMVLLPEAVSLEVQDASSVIKPGTRLDSFNFSAKVKGFATTFSKTDVENVIKTKIAALLKEGEKLAENTILVSYEQVEMNTSLRSLSLKVATRALLQEEIDPVDLKVHLAGLSKKDAVSLLSKNSALDKAEILLFPPWMGSFPKDPDKVDVVLVID